MLDPWRSGGDKGITELENREFYAIRFGRLLEIIRRHHLGHRPLQVLDAGCGRGYFTDALYHCGHEVDGVDFSSFAIAFCKEHRSGRYFCAPLEKFRGGTLYDVVIAIDVLFHILDEQTWSSTLANLAALTRRSGSLIVTDVFGDSRLELGDYIVHRTADDYDRALARHDFERREVEPYRFGTNPNSFATYRRPEI